MLGSCLFYSLITKLDLFLENVVWQEITWLLVLYAGAQVLFVQVLLWSKEKSFMRTGA